MHRNYEQVALDCAVLRQAVTDLRMWTRPFPRQPRDPEWPDAEEFVAFSDAARWVFGGQCQDGCLYSLQSICLRLSVDARKVREAIRNKLTPHQVAWLAWLNAERRLARGCA